MEAEPLLPDLATVNLSMTYDGIPVGSGTVGGMAPLRFAYAHGEKLSEGSSVHEVGTARMGNDPKTSILDAFQQARDVKTLFVVAALCSPSARHAPRKQGVRQDQGRRCQKLFSRRRTNWPN